MPGIFLSHSSKDKEFVARLAMDLSNRGFPVWFDSWEIELGDSLIDRVYGGIDDSTYLLVLLSPNSVSSSWVNKEINSALTKEEQIGRKFVIPIILEPCDVPLKIADRVHADFSKSYVTAIENLTTILKRWKADQIKVAPEKQIIPLVFVKGIHLDQSALERRLQSLGYWGREPIEFQPDQFIVSADPTYVALRNQLFHRMENIEKDPYFSPSFHQSFSSHFRAFLEKEETLKNGVRFILGGLQQSNYASPVMACYWFAKKIRGNLFYLLWSCQNPNTESKVQLDPEWDACWRVGSSAVGEEKFYETKVKTVDIGPALADGLNMGVGSFSVNINNASRIVQELEKYGVTDRLSAVADTEMYSKFIIPTMVENHINHKSKLVWDYTNFLIGLH